MSLYELSQEYCAGAEALGRRIRELKALEKQVEDDAARLSLHGRIRMLSSMWRDMREIAVLTEHYYERGHRRNAKYIL